MDIADDAAAESPQAAAPPPSPEPELLPEPGPNPAMLLLYPGASTNEEVAMLTQAGEGKAVLATAEAGADLAVVATLAQQPHAGAVMVLTTSPKMSKDIISKCEEIAPKIGRSAPRLLHLTTSVHSDEHPFRTVGFPEHDGVLVNVRRVKQEDDDPYVDAAQGPLVYQLVPPALLPMNRIDTLILNGAHRIDVQYVEELVEEARRQSPNISIYCVCAGCKNKRVVDKLLQCFAATSA